MLKNFMTKKEIKEKENIQGAKILIYGENNLFTLSN